MVMAYGAEHASQRAAIVSIASRFGCSMQTLHDWVVPFEVARPQVCL
jgi:transposase-like protein